MTRFSVVWHQEAEDELASNWLESVDRQSVSAAANGIELELAHDADAKGAYLLAGLRLLQRPPLRVIDQVREPDRLTTVLHVDSLG